MKILFVLALMVCCVLHAASPMPAAIDPTRQIYSVLRSDLLPYDMVHVIDGSYSVGPLGHIYAKAAAQLINIFYDELIGIAPDGSRAALIKFSEVALTENVFHLTKYSTLPTTNDAIAGLEFDSGSKTAIGEGLHLAKTEFNEHPSENNLKVWLFTVGKNNAGRDPENEANELKDMGAQLCIVGVGNAIDKPALDAMASELPNGGRCVLIFDTEEQYYHTLLDAVEMIKGGHGVLLKNLDIYVSKVERVTSRKIKKAKKAARKAAKRAARKAREVVSEDVKKPKKA